MMNHTRQPLHAPPRRSQRLAAAEGASKRRSATVQKAREMKNGGATKADGGATTPSNLAWSTFSVLSDHIQTIRCEREKAVLRRWREAGLVLEPAGEMAEAFEFAQEDLHSTFPDIGGDGEYPAYQPDDILALANEQDLCAAASQALADDWQMVAYGLAFSTGDNLMRWKKAVDR